MIVRDLGAGGRWYVVAVHYPSALQATRAWERASAKLDMSRGDEGIGLMRLKPNPDNSTIPSGAPNDAHSVVGITLDQDTARKTQRLLRDGTPWEPLPDFAHALILRRARVVLDAARQNPGRQGRVVIRRPE